MAEKERIINFMGPRKLLAIFSAILLLASVASLAINGLRFGLDFTGGSLVEVGYQQAADLNAIRGQLTDAGFDDAVVQTFGSSTDVLIRLGETHDPKLGDKVVEALTVNGESVELRRNEYVGAQVGEELREQGGLGMLLALAMIMLYLAFRFQFKFSLGAVLALVHDVTLVLGIFSILQLDFDLTVLAAVLAVIGYSLNDTIVVFDRIRENFRIMRVADTVEIMNASLSQTLSRTFGNLVDHGAGVDSAIHFWWGEYPWVCHGAASRYWSGYLLIDLCGCQSATRDECHQRGSDSSTERRNRSRRDALNLDVKAGFLAGFLFLGSRHPLSGYPSYRGDKILATRT